MTTELVELLHCRCGEQAFLDWDMVTECYGRDYQTVSINCLRPMCLRSVSVSCDIGEQAELDAAKQSAITAWNTRALASRAGGWLPIESAPRGREVLVWREDSGPFIAKLTTPEEVIPDNELGDMEFPDDFEEWFSDAYGWQEGSEKPTHWQPLPAAPEPLAVGSAIAPGCGDEVGS